jgi:hypothetical protein
MFGTKMAFLIHSTLIIPFIIGVFRYHELSKVYRIFLWYLLTCIVYLIAAIITVINKQGNNLYLTHFFSVLGVILLTIFLRYQIRHYVVRNVILIFAIGLSMFMLVYAFIGDNIVRYNNIPKAIEHVYFSALTCYVFYEMSIDTIKEDYGLYILNGTILFWYSSSFLIFAFANLFMDDMENLLIMANVSSIVLGMCGIAYAAGFWVASKSSDNSSRLSDINKLIH